MHEIDYNNRKFRGIVNYHDGDLTEDTLFTYYQEGKIVWGTFKGGGVLLGTLIALVDASGCLDMRFQYINTKLKHIAGSCLSTLETLEDGRYRLHEIWKVTEGSEGSGSSVVEELAEYSR